MEIADSRKGSGFATRTTKSHKKGRSEVDRPRNTRTTLIGGPWKAEESARRSRRSTRMGDRRGRRGGLHFLQKLSVIAKDFSQDCGKLSGHSGPVIHRSVFIIHPFLWRSPLLATTIALLSPKEHINELQSHGAPGQQHAPQTAELLPGHPGAVRQASGAVDHQARHRMRRRCRSFLPTFQCPITFAMRATGSTRPSLR